MGPTHGQPPVIVSIDGGLGDHASAEPSVRYLVEKVYPGGKGVLVLSHYPRIFEHLTVDSRRHGESGIENIDTLPKLFSFPRTGAIAEAVCFLTCHMVDFHSLSMLRRMLPLPDRTIRFGVRRDEHDSLREKLGGRDLRSLVVVHAGKSWRTKTFPLSWWQATTDALAKTLHPSRIVLVGKSASDMPGDTTGIVPIVAHEGVLDLRDQLSLGELMALLSGAQTLVSNDTSLIQLAGATNIHIVLIATIKAPDLVLPYREGTTGYKTTALFKRLLIEDVPFEPVRDSRIAVDFDVDDWGKYLPEPEDVVRAVIEKS